MVDVESTPNNPITGETQGLEDITVSNDNESEAFEYETESNENATGGCNFDDETAVNSDEDLGKVDLKQMSAEYILRFHFLDVDVAFMFYNWYASIQGFAARKCRVVKNSEGEITQQTFVCNREGQRRQRDCNTKPRKRRAKLDTRCGCEARCQVHIEAVSGRWYIKYFNDIHNHTFVVQKWTGMLPAHRNMNEYDKYQMNLMRSVGIRTRNIYEMFATQAGGYDKVGFQIQDMYNEQARRRKIHPSDAKAVLDLLQSMSSRDDMLIWNHTMDADQRLEKLFWCDGLGRREYSVFGDVLAFDATYKKNKYLCPLVVFSGVNHHNQSIVFAAAIVTNETEDTYVWLLQQLLEAMNGKSPVSVITDGDMAMRNAIKRVIPSAHHRLCAWHLLRNATSNIKNPKFVSRFKHCMLGDYDVEEFKRKWDKMVADFGLESNNWILELYENRTMWATAHIRGKFFAGFRTTSRCEGLHSEFGKYVNVKSNLLEFVQHFFRWLSYMRYREVEADFASAHGEPMLQTQFKCIERSAAEVYTREIFMQFQPVLQKVYMCRIGGFTQTPSLYIYTVVKYRREGMEWRVSYCPLKLEFRCSCERLESLGIPCEHLVYVLFYLDIVHLPDCVVMKRWTKAAKDSIPLQEAINSDYTDPTLISQYKGLVDRCHRMAIAAMKCGRPEFIRRTFELVTIHIDRLEAAGRGEDVILTNLDPLTKCTIKNPSRVRSKGCGGGASCSAPRKKQVCGICGRKGHNRKSCHIRTNVEGMSQIVGEGTDGCEDANANCDYATVDTNV